MSQRRDDFTTIAIKKTQKEKLDIIKIKIKAKTYAEVIDFLVKLYESYTATPHSKASFSVVEVEEVRRFSAMMPFEVKEIIDETCKNNPELRAYVTFFVKKYKLEKFMEWAKQWNNEIDCSQWSNT